MDLRRPVADAELVRAAQEDIRHFTPLYERYFADIFRAMARRVQERELAADLTQQTFLKAMLALPRYRDRGLPFRAWLYRIAFNELRMYWRKRKEVVMDVSRTELIRMAEDAGSPAGEERLHDLARALERLNADKARLIEMRYMDGLSFAEIGVILGIAEDAAKMRTHRILSGLREYLRTAR